MILFRYNQIIFIFSFRIGNFFLWCKMGYEQVFFFSCLHLSKISPSSSINNKLYLVLKYGRKFLTLSHSPPLSQDCGLQIKIGIIIRTHIQLNMYSKLFSLHLIVNQLLFWWQDRTQLETQASCGRKNQNIKWIISQFISK